MRSYADCIHCFIKQGVTCMRLAGVDENLQYQVIFELMDYIKTFDLKASPAENASKVLQKAYGMIGNNDPYCTEKKQCNDLAMAIYPRLKAIVDTSDDRLYAALKISVTGNIIDLGIQRSFDIEKQLKKSMEFGFSKDQYSRFLEKLDKADKILFLGDNAGEVVFDKVLVEELIKLGKSVVYVVKSSPILNDSTMEDAVYTGMDKIAEVITNGSGYMGSCLNDVSTEFIELLKGSEIVIAKGHANFESLEESDLARDRIFFLLKAKCDAVAEAIGIKLGDIALFTR